MIKIFGDNDIAGWIKYLSEKIIQGNAEGANLVIIGMRTRGEFIARRIQKLIADKTGREIPLGILDVSFYRDDTRAKLKQPVVQSTQIPFDLTDKRIILADDVIFTGRSVRAALDGIMDFGRPAKIELAVLIDRGGRELPIEPTYLAHKVILRSNEAIKIHLQEFDSDEGVYQIEC